MHEVSGRHVLLRLVAGGLLVELSVSDKPPGIYRPFGQVERAAASLRSAKKDVAKP
jgi:hypothetical protein